MASAANANSEKPASSEAMFNSPIRQVMTIIEQKIRNLEKSKNKLTSYRVLQKAGKDLHSDQKVAAAKYDEVSQTLEFAMDLAKQISSIAVSAERHAKKQAKWDAWVRYAADTNKIREVLLILDCLTQMGNSEARDDFLNGVNGAVKLTEDDLKTLDDLIPEVTPKHEVNEEGQAAFHIHSTRAAEHLYAIIDGKPKEVLGTTYTRIKEIVTAVHECGYFDRISEEVVKLVENLAVVPEELQESIKEEIEVEQANSYPHAGALPVPPATAYPLRPVPLMTLQVDQAHFRSPVQDETGERKTQRQGDGQNRFRRYGARGGNRGAPNGHRGRGTFPGRQGEYRGRHAGKYQNRFGKDNNYQSRQYGDSTLGYQGGFKMSRALKNYYRANIRQKLQTERHCYWFLKNPTELKNIKNITLLRQQMPQPVVKTEIKEERCDDELVDEGMATDLSMAASEPWRKRARPDPTNISSQQDKHRISALIGDNLIPKRESEYSVENMR